MQNSLPSVRQYSFQLPNPFGGATNVQDSIAWIVDSKFIPHRDSVRGFDFDVATGKLDEVTAA